MADTVVNDVAPESASSSILDTIKKLIGPSAEYDYFNPDLIAHINAVFTELTQLGIGPKSGFAITGNTETWADFIGDDLRLGSVITLTYLKVRLVFDPPQSGTLVDVMNRQIDRLEWRLNMTVDTEGPIQ